MDEFLIDPSLLGIVPTMEHCKKTCPVVDSLLRQLGLSGNSRKGEWASATSLTHLIVEIGRMKLRFWEALPKNQSVRRFFEGLLPKARMGHRRVGVKDMGNICGMCVSLSLAIPWVQFYTGLIHWHMAANLKRDKSGRVRPFHQRIIDLLTWRSLSKG